jgi:DNA-3-methyladenine glycosylase II
VERAVAAAAEAGRLDADHLRGQPPEAALAGLQQIAGIGPFSSEGVLLRGAGIPDYLSLREPRLRQQVGLAYGLDHVPTDERLVALAEGWRPFRTWVGVLMRSAGEPEDQNVMASQTAMARSMSSKRGTRARRK